VSLVRRKLALKGSFVLFDGMSGLVKKRQNTSNQDKTRHAFAGYFWFSSYEVERLC